MQCRSPSPMSRPGPGSARPPCPACSTARASSTLRTAARVRQVIDELGYVPSARAVGLARGRTRIVGMLVPSLTWPWMGEVLQGAVDVVETEGYGLLLFTCNRGEESMRQFAVAGLGQVVRRPAGDRAGGHPRLHRATARPRPAGGADRRPRAPARSSRPSPPPTTPAARRAARHLLELGRRRPLVITGVERFGCTQERLDGFADVYAEAGIPLDPRLVFDGDFTFDCGRRGVQHALDQPASSFDADLRAQRPVRRPAPCRPSGRPGGACRRTWRSSGSTTSRCAAHTEPPLTTVHQPMRADGRGGGPDADGPLRRHAAARRAPTCSRRR